MEVNCMLTSLPWEPQKTQPQPFQPQVTATTATPGIIVIQDNRITLLKLTVPANTPEGLQGACRRKHLKTSYVALVTDLEVLGVSSALDTTEIGTLGHFTNQSTACMPSSPNIEEPSPTISLLDLSKISLSCSAHIRMQCKVLHHMIFTPFTRHYPSPTDNSFTELLMNVHVYILAFITLKYSHPSPFPPPYIPHLNASKAACEVFFHSNFMNMTLSMASRISTTSTGLSLTINFFTNNPTPPEPLTAFLLTDVLLWLNH